MMKSLVSFDTATHRVTSQVPNSHVHGIQPRTWFLSIDMFLSMISYYLNIEIFPVTVKIFEKRSLQLTS